MPAFRMPSFRDGHCHPLFAGREALGPNISDCKTLLELQASLKLYSTEHADVEWIDASSYSQALAEGRNRFDLDNICDLPIVLHAEDHHTLWVNTEALKRAGLLEHIPTLANGIVDIDEFGNPTGILREWDAMRLVLDKIPALSLDAEVEALSMAQQKLLSLGITQVQDAWIDPGMTEIYVEFAKRGLLQIRTDLALRFDPQTWRDDLAYFKNCQQTVSDLGHARLAINAAKFFADGVLGSATALLSQAYQSDSTNFGKQVWEPAEMQAAIDSAISMGLAPHIHAIGDAAINLSLNALESFKTNLRLLKNPPVIAHCELISDFDLARFADLGVVANMQPLWARKDDAVTSCAKQIGQDRVDSMYRMRSLLDTGATISFGSDWPVSDPNPLLGAYTAVYRAAELGDGWSTQESLTIQEALEVYTFSASQQVGQTPTQIENLADTDFIVLSANPLTASRQELLDICVRETYIEGKLVWPVEAHVQISRVHAPN